MAIYRFSGPVTQFGVCICNHWSGATTAPTKEKARSNLTYRFKKETGKTADSSIKLEGEIEEVE